MAPCEMNNLLSRYHDGALCDEQRLAVEQHLPHCAPCASELEQLRAISRALRTIALPRASSQFMHRLEALASEVEDVAAIRFVRRLTAAAAAILLATTVRWAIPRQPAPAPVTVANMGTDERMIMDPESAANSATPDGNVAMADTQLDALSTALSGGRP